MNDESQFPQNPLSEYGLGGAARRRESDYVTTTQLELMTEKFARSIDNAVLSITGKVDLLGIQLEKKLDGLEQSTDFRDRALAARIDALDLRMNGQENKLEEVSTRGSRNFRLAITSLVAPITVGVAVYVIEKVVS